MLAKIERRESPESGSDVLPAGEWGLVLCSWLQLVEQVSV